MEKKLRGRFATSENKLLRRVEIQHTLGALFIRGANICSQKRNTRCIFLLYALDFVFLGAYQKKEYQINDTP